MVDISVLRNEDRIKLVNDVIVPEIKKILESYIDEHSPGGESPPWGRVTVMTESDPAARAYWLNFQIPITYKELRELQW